MRQGGVTYDSGVDRMGKQFETVQTCEEEGQGCASAKVWKVDRRRTGEMIRQEIT